MMLKGIVGGAAIFLVYALSVGQTGVVVLTGQLAPGTNGAVFASVGRPSINNFGDVAFKADLKGTGSHNGIFVASGGSLSRVVAFGDAAPNSSPLFTNFGDPALNDSREVAFAARLGRGYDNQGVFLQTSTGLTSIALTGSAAPGTTGAFERLGEYGLVLNNSGKIAFQATFNGPEPGDGIFEYSNGTLRAVVLRGQSVPGSQGEIFDHFVGLAMNQTGQIAFVASLNGGASGIFVADNGGIRTIALEGQPAPYPGGGTFGNLRQPSINDAGDVAFVDATARPGRFGKTFFPKGVFVAASGALSAAASAGTQPRPGDPILTGNFQQPLVVRSDDGTNSVLFVAWNQVWGRNALLLWSHGALAQLLQESDEAVGGGVHSFIGNLALASSGHFAFVSNLEGSSAKAGIFVNKISF